MKASQPELYSEILSQKPKKGREVERGEGEREKRRRRERERERVSRCLRPEMGLKPQP